MMRSAGRVLGRRPPGRLLRRRDDRVKSSPSWGGVTPFAPPRSAPSPDGDALQRHAHLRRDEPRRVVLVSVQTSRTTKRAIVQPACFAAASSADRCTPVRTPRATSRRTAQTPADGRPSPRVKPPPSAAIAERRPGRVSSHWWLQRSGRR
jgi:hypothetical protein